MERSKVVFVNTVRNLERFGITNNISNADHLTRIKPTCANLNGNGESRLTGNVDIDSNIHTDVVVTAIAVSE